MNEWQYEGDVHGLKCKEALEIVRCFIRRQSDLGNRYIEIIHGFSHGNALKIMFSDINNYDLDMVYFIEPSLGNDGRTCVYLKERKDISIKKFSWLE